MHVSLAAITVAYHVLNTAPFPSTTAYFEIARRIETALGRKAAAKLFAQCAAAVAANPYPATYQAMAQQVIAQRNTTAA